MRALALEVALRAMVRDYGPWVFAWLVREMECSHIAKGIVAATFPRIEAEGPTHGGMV